MRSLLKIPLFLGGGLTVENVHGIIDDVGPDAIILDESIETDGLLDQAKLRAFLTAIARAED